MAEPRYASLENALAMVSWGHLALAALTAPLRRRSENGQVGWLSESGNVV